MDKNVPAKKTVVKSFLDKLKKNFVLSDLPKVTEPLPDDLVAFPMDYKVGVTNLNNNTYVSSSPPRVMTASERKMYEQLKEDLKNLQVEHKELRETFSGSHKKVDFGKILSDIKSLPQDSWPDWWSKVPTPVVSHSSPPFAITGSYTSGSITSGMTNNNAKNWLNNPISSPAANTIPIIPPEGRIKAIVNIGDPSQSMATVGFKNGGMSNTVWLTDNVKVVKDALFAFDVKVFESLKFGKTKSVPWFNCVVQEDSGTYRTKRVSYGGLLYEEHVIKANITYQSDTDQDPMAVLNRVNNTYRFFVVGDMEVNEDESIIEEFVVTGLWCFNPQTKKNEPIFEII